MTISSRWNLQDKLALMIQNALTGILDKTSQYVSYKGLHKKEVLI